jgi:hypothetical protein
VQIAYLATIGTQLFMVVLSIVLLFGIFKVQDTHTEWLPLNLGWRKLGVCKLEGVRPLREEGLRLTVNNVTSWFIPPFSSEKV